MKERVKRIYWKVITKQMDGIGVIEIILILVIIIGLVLIFRDQIEAIIKDAFNTINGDVEGIGTEIDIN
ncbi:MAG: putative Flagellin, Flp1-like, domain [Herbinix sp.]|nr:putative Flagellin, Flp1-like, domain [Herbinix sp.]